MGAQRREQIIAGGTECAIEPKAPIGERTRDVGAQETRMFAFHLLATPLS
jgi:hypothetical protein